MTPDFRRDCLVGLPLPLAQLYGRAGTAKDARSQHDNTFYLLEALIKLAAMPCIAAYVQELRRGQPRVEALDRHLVQIALPSLGQWVAMLRELAAYFSARVDADTHPLGHLGRQLLAKHKSHPALLALYRRIKNGPDGQPGGDEGCSLLQLFEALVQYRNGVFGHGGPRFELFYEREMGPLFWPAANEIVAEGMLDFLGPRGSRLVYMSGQRTREDGRIELSLRELLGLKGEPLPPITLSTVQAGQIETNQLAVLWPGHTVPLRLDPLLAYRESDQGEEVLFLNRDRNGRQVEYLSYTTGGTERDRTTAAALAALLSCITGREIDSAQLRRISEQTVAETPSVEGLLGGPPTMARLGNYEILAELGRGGMGVVYLARQLSLGRLVALKMLPAELAGDEHALARFRREVRALSRCEHPNIVKVLASGTMPDGQLFYTMEYVTGCDLECIWRELAGLPADGPTSRMAESTWSDAVQSGSRKQRQEIIRRQAQPTASDLANSGDSTKPASTSALPLPPLPTAPRLRDDAGGCAPRLALLFRDAARALQAVHDQGLVHRDIKPANLMMTPDGQRIVLMDFGLAKGHNLTAATTQAGGFLGSLRFAAPEQLASGSQPVGPAADVRGLGVTLWELLSRRRLFADAADEKRLSQLIQDEDVPRLRSVDPGLDRDLDAIVARATERRPADRIATAGQMADYLQLYLDGKPLPIRPAGVLELTGRWLRKRRSLVASAAATAAALVLMAVLFIVKMEQRQGQDQRADAYLVHVTQLQDLGQWSEARSLLIRCEEDLDGTGREDLVDRVRLAHKDLAMVERLEEIPQRRIMVVNSSAEGGEDGFDHSGANAAYRTAFFDYGLDLERSDWSAVSRLIQESAIREPLLRALDEWSDTRRKLRTSADRLVEIANMADANNTRKAVRDAVQRKDRERLKDLASRIDDKPHPPGTLHMLAVGLDANGERPTGEGLLKRAWHRDPTDCWANFDIATWCSNAPTPRFGEAVGYLRAAVAVRPQSAAIWVDLAHSLNNTGQRSEAVAAYQKALEIHKDFAFAYNGLGVTLYSQGKIDDAIAAYRKAIDYKKDNAIAYYNLGNAYREEVSTLDDAVLAYRKAIDIKENYAEAYHAVGRVLRDLKKPDEALAAFRKAIKVRKGYGTAYIDLGTTLVAQGKFDEAVAALREGLAVNLIDKKTAELYNGLGIALRRQGKLEDALTAYQKALTIEKDHPQAQYNLGLTLSDMGKLDEAVAAYHKAIDIFRAEEKRDAPIGGTRTARDFKQDLAGVYCNLGHILQTQGKFDEAIGALRTAIEIDKDASIAYYNLGIALSDQHKLDDAVSAYRKAIELEPGNASAYFNLGNTLIDQNKLDLALAAYRKSIELQPDDAKGYNSLGNVLGRQGKVDEAMAAVKKAISLKADYPLAHYNLGVFLVKKGKRDEAVAAYRKAIELKKDYANAHNNLGGVLIDQGKFDEAIAVFRGLLAIKPDNALAHTGLGFAMRGQGKFADSLANFRRGHELGMKPPAWSSPSAQWVREAEQFARLEKKLSDVLSGKTQVADGREAAELASFCQLPSKELYTASAQFFADAFAAMPDLADDFVRSYRYDAACVAALAGCGKGKDAAILNAEQKSKWRRQSLDWLRADLKHWAKEADSPAGKDRADGLQRLVHWQKDSDLSGVREQEALAALPEDEAIAWRTFWGDVSALQRRLQPRN
jgi:tetratricopeptide (TPR) repeat protein